MAFLLPQLLTESVSRNPRHQAVRWSDQSLSYAQLESLSNQLARTLRDLGIRNGDRVGIYVNKSIASIIAVFAIMKAGAAYVPLDPKAPPSRLGYIATNCGIVVLLCSAAKFRPLAELLSEAQGIRNVILTDEETINGGEFPEINIIQWHEVMAVSDSDVKVTLTDTDLAYILYTSGSTGRPKGVMISHRTILTFIDWAVEEFGMGQADRVTSHAPLHFDLSTFDIYATVKAGGTIVLVPEAYSLFPTRLAALLDEEAVTIIYMVPSLLAQLTSEGNLVECNLSSLRQVIFAGEVFPIKYLRKLAALIPHANYTNLYGPTETNVCTYYQVTDDDLDPCRIEPVPIGKACGNMEVFIVNDDGKKVEEKGIKGELWVRGNCVSKGYWADPERTAASFVRNIFQPHYYDVAYRTGDIVFLDDNGDYTYCGRRDHMVKVRGHRIELGEIETVLSNNPDISEVAVIAIADEMSGSLIKVFITPEDGAVLTETGIKRYCSGFLPRYMIPDSIVAVETIPKTSSGKVDRRRLCELG